MASAFLTRITPAGDLLLTPYAQLAQFRTASGGNEDLPTTEEAGIDGEGAGPQKTEPGRGCQADERRDAIEMRQHGPLERLEQHEGITHAEKGAARGGKESDCQRETTHAQGGCGRRGEEIRVRRGDGEPGLQCRREADSPAQQQKAEACPVAWIVQDAPLLEVCPATGKTHYRY